MAEHKLKSILDDILTRLSTPDGDTYPTDASTKVYLSRSLPVQAGSQLPCILIYPRSETADVEEITSPQTYDRSCNVAITALVNAGDDDPESALLDLAQQISDVIEADVSCGGNADTTTYITGEWTEPDAKAAQTIRALRLTYQIAYTYPEA